MSFAFLGDEFWFAIISAPSPAIQDEPKNKRRNIK